MAKIKDIEALCARCGGRILVTKGREGHWAFIHCYCRTEPKTLIEYIRFRYRCWKWRRTVRHHQSI